MSKVLGLVSAVDRHQVGVAFEDGLKYTLGAALEKDSGYTLFRYEDWPAWVIFTCVFLVLIVFDNVILHRNPKSLTVGKAVAYTLFYVCMAFCFAGWVAWWYNPSSSYMWLSGYMLEWMLSFDNLFVFHMIFSVYGCPDNLKHKPLYYGIMGAVVMRLAFIFIGEWLMHAMTFMHLIFGSFLVYTGIKTVSGDEEDEDPSQQPLVIWLQSRMAFVNVYDSNGAFFVKCPVKENGEADIPEDAITIPEPTETDSLVDEDGEERKKVGIVDFSRFAGSSQRMETRATMLFLVVCCLEISDLLFAVDSVSAIVAQVNDLFLAYTSAVFAMLGLRATFFIIDVLVQLFSLLKYGVAIVLVFVGVKLIVGKFYHIPASIVCVVLVGAIAGSMIASVIQDKLQKKHEGKMSPEVAERIAKIKGSPFASPMPAMRKV
jgi:tellurite resistance protein TerC